MSGWLSLWTKTVPRDQPSPFYLLTLAFGCIGLTFMGFGLGGALIGRSGGDPLDAMNTVGMAMFLLGFAVAFSMRLIFWPRAPAVLRSAVRTAISVIFIIAIPAALLGLDLALQLPATVKNIAAPISFSVFAALCQIGSAIWLARYRREGL